MEVAVEMDSPVPLYLMLWPKFVVFSLSCHNSHLTFGPGWYRCGHYPTPGWLYKFRWRYYWYGSTIRFGFCLQHINFYKEYHYSMTKGPVVIQQEVMATFRYSLSEIVSLNRVRFR